METYSEERAKRIAVLAVHGVGKHLPGETQTAITDLLLSLPARNREGEPRLYSAFRKTDLAIPLKPVQTAAAVPFVPERKGRDKLVNLYQEPSADFAEAIKRTNRVQHPDQIALEYTQMLLEGYKGGADSNLYATARLEGTRVDGTEVDVYEVLWADLAKPENTIYRFFLDLFRLLLHLADLSSKAIDTGAAEGRDWLWTLYRSLQRYAVRFFSVFVPLIEILLLIAFLSCAGEASLLTRGRLEVPIALGALGAVAVDIWWIQRSSRKISEAPWLWAINRFVVVILGALPAAFAWLLYCLHQRKLPVATTNIFAAVLFWLVPGSMLMFAVCWAYDKSKNGVSQTGAVSFLVALGIFCCFLHSAAHGSGKFPVAQASLWTVELLLGFVRLFWGAMIVCGVTAATLGSLAWRRMRRQGGEWGRARAAVRTSRFALALPTLLFMLVTLLIWRGIVKTSSSIASKPIYSQTGASPTLPTPWPAVLPLRIFLPPAALGRASNSNSQDYPSELLAWGFGYSLPWALLCTALAVFLFVWWVLPSVLTERSIPRGEDRPPRDTTDHVSVRMGTWMSRGLDAHAVASWLLWTAVFGVPLLYLAASCGSSKLNSLFEPITRSLVGHVFVGFAALATLAKMGQTALSTMLDVDTYLRATPQAATPRAKIFERYVSMLRYLRDPAANQRGYDEIVIIAHSLGALISADLLQYLQSPMGRREWWAARQNERDPHFTRIPISLMTMGNPLRQLLNRFFPYLYTWVRSVPDNGNCPLGAPALDTPKPIPDEASPDPSSLGVCRWVNAYRSGDYVGRSLWVDEWYLRPSFLTGAIDPAVVGDSSHVRCEMCIGAGAHTRYMDDTAPDIAWMLNRLIGQLPFPGTTATLTNKTPCLDQESRAAHTIH